VGTVRTMNDTIEALSLPGPKDGWRWWEARRLRYNIGLGIAGLAAYSAFWLVMLGFGDTRYIDMRSLVSMTAFMGAGYLIVIAVANACYLIGVGLEALIKPADKDGFRERFWALGFWASCALPFLLPLGALAVTLSLGPID
jgi:hypothetical protein